MKDYYILYNIFYQNYSREDGITYFYGGRLQIYYDEITIPLLIQLSDQIILKNNEIILDNHSIIPVTKIALDSIKTPVKIIDLTKRISLCQIWWGHYDQNECWKNIIKSEKGLNKY